MADLPIKQLGDEAPEYDRPWTKPEPKAPPTNGFFTVTLLLGRPNTCDTIQRLFCEPCVLS